MLFRLGRCAGRAKIFGSVDWMRRCGMLLIEMMRQVSGMTSEASRNTGSRHAWRKRMSVRRSARHIALADALALALEHLRSW